MKEDSFGFDFATLIEFIKAAKSTECLPGSKNNSQKDGGKTGREEEGVVRKAFLTGRKKNMFWRAERKDTVEQCCGQDSGIDAQVGTVERELVPMRDRGVLVSLS